MLCGVAYYKREGIKNRITKIMAFQNNLKTENMIKSMNQEVFIPVSSTAKTSFLAIS